MVGGIFLAYQNRPPKWRILKYRKWKKELEERNKREKERPLRYR